MKYVRLYADKNGHAHFENAVIKLDEADYRPPAPMMFVSHAYATDGLQFIRLPSGWPAEFDASAQETISHLSEGPA